MFVRHAEDKNDKLTKLGKLQCKMFLKSKETVKFSKIYTSPANRCLQTAKIIQNKWKLPLEITENLNERELLETAEPQNDHEKEWYENYMNPLYSSEKPEGCKDFLTRTFVAFKKIVNEHIEKNENARKFIDCVTTERTKYIRYEYVQNHLNQIRQNIK